MSESHPWGGAAGPSTDSDDKTFPCQECAKEYETQGGLAHHYRSDNNDCTGYECPTCGRDHFTTKRGVQMHRGRDHGENGSYYPKLSDREWFERKYVYEGYSTAGIAKLVGCSAPQAAAWKRKHGIETQTQYKSRGMGNDNPNGDRLITECATCGNELSRPRYKVEKPGNNFCNWPCLYEWMSQQTGEDHPLYKPNKTLDYGPNWKEQSEKCRERDGYECQNCGKHQDDHFRKLVAHHIISREHYVDENGVYDHERGNRLDNLVALCDSCHPKWEGIPLRPSRHA